MIATISVPRTITAALLIILALVVGLALMATKVGGLKELKRREFSGSDLSPGYGLAVIAFTVLTLVLLNPLSGDRSVPLVPILVILIGLIISWLVIRSSR